MNSTRSLLSGSGSSKTMQKLTLAWGMAFIFNCTYAADSEAPVDIWRTCNPLNSIASHYQPPPEFSPEDIKSTQISARKVENTTSSVTHFIDDVILLRHQLRLTSDRVTYDKNQELLTIDDRLHIDVENLAIDAQSGSFNLSEKNGQFSDAEYFLPEAHLRGAAPSLSLQGENNLTLEDTYITSCPGERRDWYLQADQLDIDNQQREGTAHDTTLWFKGIPLFYFPWLRFPLGDERRSGFLAPGFGTSDSRGVEFSLPWYWNIAPNQDAIITPRLMSYRGLQLNTYYRFLTHSSSGSAEIEYLDKDKQYEDSRYLAQITDRTQITPGLLFNLKYNDVSDEDYFSDLGSSIQITNITHLESHAKLNYYRGPFTLGLLAQDYKTVDTAIPLDSRPHQRLPQITLDGNDDLGVDWLHWDLSAEWVDFKHESETQVQGQRFDVYPELSLPVERPGWFLKPAVGLHHTEYNVRENDTELDLATRDLSVVSLDSGLFFERYTDNGNIIQTLEPRIFYLEIPYEDQSDLPLFDTSELDFSFASLYSKNRFSGPDRIGDTRQLTTGVTSRLINRHSGDEYMNFSLGQIHYFTDRRVTLNDAPVEDPESDIISEIGGQYQHWMARNTLQWNQGEDRFDKASLLVRYKSDHRQIVNLGFRSRRDDTQVTGRNEQTDFSFVAPLSDRYTLLGRWNYSITDDEDIESMLALQYDSCCWAMRLLGQRYLTDDETWNESIMFQLVLKGLGSVSDRQATKLLEQSISGYTSEY